MFTGIVERSLPVVSVTDGTGFRRITLGNPWGDVKIGDSIAINGVCLTVAEMSGGVLGFDAIPETLAKTNLGMLEAGSVVHVERALRAGDRMDGHFVQGHVDGTAQLLEVVTAGGEYRLRIETPVALGKYLIPKGSVTLDGVSLTIAGLTASTFDVALVPTTLAVTAMGRRGPGWLFNLECDVLSKTIVTYLERMKGAVPL